MKISLLLSIVSFVILVTGLGLWLFGERGHLALDSTKSWFTDQHWKKNGKLIKSIHGYIYMRWQNQYIKYFVIQMGKIAPQTYARIYQKTAIMRKFLPTKKSMR